MDFLARLKGYFKKKESVTESLEAEQLASLTSENEKLKAKLVETESDLQKARLESAKASEEQKAKYETLLKDANAKSEQLKSQLDNALEGHLDEAIKGQLTESDKLKKRIKDLEEELEEAEDDLSDAKKKLKNKDVDIAELQDNYAKEHKKNTELSSELASVKQERDEKSEQLKLNMGSLDFVQEILSADESSSEDIETLKANIAEMRSFALDQLLDCYATVRDMIPSSMRANLDQNEFKKEECTRRFDEWASVTRKNWINGKTTIAFVGEFSAGKTSIVNRILSMDNPNAPKLPVSTKATTAIATYIAGGPAEHYRFVTPDDKLKNISLETFTQKVSKEILDQVKGVTSLIKYFVMTYKNPNLEGLSILDTPGFNSNDSKDGERTMEVINECDALFWVMDVNAGTVNRSSIEIIKKHLTKPLYVVINKVDTKADSEVKKAEDQIKNTLNEARLKVEGFIRFSAKANMDNIMKPIKSVTHRRETEEYLLDLERSIDTLILQLDSEAKKAYQQYQSTTATCNHIDDRFIDRMRTLNGHCQTAADIPHFEEHLFKKDNYEMSQGEYSRLRNVLDQSREDVIQMASIYDDKTEAAANERKAWEDFIKNRTAWQNANNLKKQFEKLQKKHIK